MPAEKRYLYLQKVVSSLYSDNFTDFKLGVERELALNLGRCYLIGSWINIPSMKAAAISKLENHTWLHAKGGAMLDVAELVYGSGTLCTKDFVDWFLERGECVIRSPNKVTQKRVADKITKDKKLGADLFRLKEIYPVFKN